MATKRRSCEFCVHATEDETKQTHSMICLLDWTKKIKLCSVCENFEPYMTAHKKGTLVKCKA